MFGDGSLTFREFITGEPLPLARVHDAVLEFLRRRTDTVLVGAHAANTYVRESRMSQDVDIVSPRPAELAAELRNELSNGSRSRSASGLRRMIDTDACIMTANLKADSSLTSGRSRAFPVTEL